VKNFLFIVIASLCIVTCTQEEVGFRSYSRITTSAVTGISEAGATFNGEITLVNGTISDHGFIWSLYEHPTFQNSDSVSLGTIQSAGPFSTDVKRGLVANITYYVRAYLRSGAYLVYGDVVSFSSKGSDEPALLNPVPPNHLMPRSKVTVFYGNLNKNIKVMFNGDLISPDQITGIARDSFVVQVPDNPRELNDLSVLINGQEVAASQRLSFALSQNSELTVGIPRVKSAFTVGEKAYIGLGSDSSFTFDPASNKIQFLGKQIIPRRSGFFGFAIDGVGYFGGGSNQGGLKDFYSIDAGTDKITRLADLADESTVYMFAFNNKGYRVTLKPSPFVLKTYVHEFDPVSKSWTEKPGDAPYFNNNVTTFESNGSLYFVRTEANRSTGAIEIWSYDPDSNVWTQGPDSDIKADNLFGIVYANNKVYLATTLNDDDFFDPTYLTSFSEFDPSTTTFNTKFSTTVPFRVLGTFSIASAGYIFSDSYLWKFDPSL